MTKALMIIAQEGFQDVELNGTRKELMENDIVITLASEEAGKCVGKFGGIEQAALSLGDVEVTDYELIAYIGGPGAAHLKDNDEALRIARETVDEGILLGAICIAPTILAEAGVLNGKKATVWDDGEQTQIKFLQSQGATFVDEDVVVDGQIVTANGPEAAEEFGSTLASRI